MIYSLLSALFFHRLKEALATKIVFQGRSRLLADQKMLLYQLPFLPVQLRVAGHDPFYSMEFFATLKYVARRFLNQSRFTTLSNFTMANGERRSQE
jgi:hypothetical protein